MMDDVVATVNCESCGNDFEVLARNYEKVVHEDMPVLCAACFERIMDEQNRPEAPERRKFEYNIVVLFPDCKSDHEGLSFAIYGQEGWELVQIVNNKAYFKREYVKGLDSEK